MDASQVNDVVDKLAQKLGPLGEEAIRQTVTLGLAKLIGGVVLLACTVGLILWTVRLARQYEGINDGNVLGVILGGIAALLGMIGSSVLIGDGVAMWLAPITCLLGK